jgi:hypothetical protein
MHRARTAFAAVALAGLAAGIVPAAAFADSSAITIQWAQNTSDNNGKFQVSLSATSPITTISADLYSYAAGQVVATVSTFVLVSGTAEAGQWEPPSRVQLPALGSYRIDLTVSDSAGDTLTQIAAGNFFYMVQTLFRDVSVDRHSVDIAHQQVVISGSLFGRAPDTGTVTAVPGFPITISNAFEEDNLVTTGADGSFSAVETVTEAGALQAIYRFDNDHLNYQGSQSAEFPIKLVQSATKFVQNLSASRIPSGGSVTLSGTLLWNSPAGWQPLANKTVGANGCGILGAVTTDTSGNFVLPTSPPLQADCTLLTGWQSDDPFMKDTSASVSVIVIQPAYFSDFTAGRADAGSVSVQGHIQFPGFNTPFPVLIDIQYSPTGKGGWTTEVTDLTADWDGMGYYFATTIPSDTAGYWRASFTGGKQFTNAKSTTSYVPAP